MSTPQRLISAPNGTPVRVILTGDVPRAVVYDLPTGRHAAMTIQVINNNPRLKALIRKVKVGNREGYVIARDGLMAMADIYAEIHPHREDTQAANETFVTWVRQSLIPAMDLWAQELRGFRQTLTISASLSLRGARFQGDFQDPHTDTTEEGLTLVVNGLFRTFRPEELARELGMLK